MEIMAFLVGAAARLNPSSTDDVTAWPRATQTARTVKDADTTNRTRDWPGHWAVAKYL